MKILIYFLATLFLHYRYRFFAGESAEPCSDFSVIKIAAVSKLI